MGELGDRLRQAREARGLSLEQMEDITKIRRRYLQALEEEDYGQFPAEVFIRGFLRNYAVALGLDPDEVLALSGRRPSYPALQPREVRQPLLDEPLSPQPRSHGVIAAVIGAMVLVSMAIGAWILYQYTGPVPTPPVSPPPGASLVPVGVETTASPTTTAFAPAPTVTLSPSATASPTPTLTATAPSAGVLIRREATDRSWIRIVADGQQVFEGFMDPGQTREWQAHDQIFLRTGNAGGLKVWYNGEEQSPLGAPGELVEHTWGSGPVATKSPQELSGEPTPGPVGTPPTPG